MTEPVKSIALPSMPANDTKAMAEQKLTASVADDQPIRLVVEPINGGQSFTYKLYDRTTGALLIELPREEATKMGQSQDYAAGQVIDAKA